MLDATIDEGFACVVGGGSCNIEYTFDNWIDPSTGSDDTYDFETSSEGFLPIEGGGDVCTIPYTFIEPMNTGADCT